MLPGMDKKNSYDLFWLGEDMQTMGNLFEYSHLYAKNLCGFVGEFDRLKFAESLMTSGIRREMDWGHPKLLSESIEEVFLNYYEVDLGSSLEQFRATEPQPDLYENQMYWAGEAYAYIHYHADMLSKDVFARMPLKVMLHYYITGHQLEFCDFYDRVKEAFK